VYVITTNTGGWIEGSNTDVRVEFEDDAKVEAELWSGPGENMLEKCVWRLLFERRGEVCGNSVTFTLGRRDVLGLIDRLRAANSEPVN
jgi:hypothetical protein